ncbi:MAG: hypothetical protein K2P12_01160, partial [Clostridia bacterium]|nr:hypothetical protein [Clostridia bacterium]
KKGDKYYCTIMINTTDMSVDKGNYQGAVVKAIEKATGGKYDQFNEDTRMVAELERIDDTFRFTQFILMEDYQGKKDIGFVITMKVSQYYWHKFDYDTKSITIPERK